MKFESKPKTAFICVHNSCRSQIAEALGKLLGTEVKAQINPDAVRVIKALYGVDMSKSQRPKLLSDIPPVDIVITMGCNVECPVLPCKYRFDWGLDDPTGKDDSEFEKTAKLIEQKIMDLCTWLK